MKRIAVIDLGTNTFHLLIAERTSEGKHQEIFRLREYVYLGEEGIRHIGDAAFERGIEVLKKFAKLIEYYRVEQFRAVGTSALRNADNGEEFIRRSLLQTSIPIEIIQGLEEAFYIYKGVSQLIQNTEHHDLIMDIGGGSVEYIYTHAGQINWSGSYKTGISVLYQIIEGATLSDESKAKLRRYLDSQYTDWPDILKPNKMHRLIGASGTFEALAQMTDQQYTQYATIDIQKFKRYYQEIGQLDLDARRRHPLIPIERAKYISVSFYLIDYIIERLAISELYVSHYAMKEGILCTLD